MEYYIVLEKQAWRDAHEIFLEKNNFRVIANFILISTHTLGICVCIHTGMNRSIERYKVHIGYFKEWKDVEDIMNIFGSFLL